MSEFLKEPTPITAQLWDEDTVPLVSISCITYNHEKYIRDAIEGFLMQKTTFPIEILIHDDASTDNTATIVREYEVKYPQLIKPIYQTENQYSKKDGTIGRIQRGRARGKYYATCEGDDYWTDSLKLQKQVEFLEENTDCSLCFHASKSIRNNDPNDYMLHRPKEIPKDNKFEMKDAILGGGGFMATNSMCFLRNCISDLPEWLQKAPVGDAPLMLLLASKGGIGYIDDVMSVYRVMSSSTSWSASMQDRFVRKIHHYAILKMWDDFDKWSNMEFHSIVVKKKNKNKWSYFKGLMKSSFKSFIK